MPDPIQYTRVRELFDFHSAELEAARSNLAQWNTPATPQDAPDWPDTCARAVAFWTKRVEFHERAISFLQTQLNNS